MSGWAGLAAAANQYLQMNQEKRDEAREMRTFEKKETFLSKLRQEAENKKAVTKEVESREDGIYEIGYNAAGTKVYERKISADAAKRIKQEEEGATLDIEGKRERLIGERADTRHKGLQTTLLEQFGSREAESRLATDAQSRRTSAASAAAMDAQRRSYDKPLMQEVSRDVEAVMQDAQFVPEAQRRKAEVIVQTLMGNLQRIEEMIKDPAQRRNEAFREIQKTRAQIMTLTPQRTQFNPSSGAQWPTTPGSAPGHGGQ